jgi:single-strand DNA-binding protein
MATATLTISGNLTNDPELTFTANGAPRLSFGVAVNYGYTDAQGEKQEKTSFFNVTAWRYLAENSARTLEKGIGVVVTGRLEQRSYEDKDGVKRSAVDLIADEIGIATRSLETIERRAKQEGTTQSNGGQQASNRPKTGPARTMPMTNKAIQFTPDTEEEPF